MSGLPTSPGLKATQGPGDKGTAKAKNQRQQSRDHLGMNVMGMGYPRSSHFFGD